MSVTNRLVYDATDADTKAASSTIGSYVLAGTDGTAIGHVSDALKVDIGSVSQLDIDDLDYTVDSITAHQGGSWTVAATQSGSWSATVSATDLDIRALTQTDEITAYQGTSPWVIGDGGSSITVDATQLDIDDLVYTSDSVTAHQGGVWSATVSATQLDIDDLDAATDSVAAWVKDGSGNAITSTASALDVNIKSGDIDDSLANTAIENTAKSVSTTTGVVLASALADRKWLLMQNLGSKHVYIGKAGVTTANGFQLPPQGAIEMRLGASVALHGVAVSGTQDCRVMELS